MPEAHMLHNKRNRAGSEVQYDPRPVGAVLKEMLRSDSPLAKGYRKHFASVEKKAEKGGEI